MNKFLKNALLVALLATTAVLMSCTEDDDDTTELPAVSASFTQTIDLETGTVTFLNTSENATTYAWDFGDGTSSTLFEPSKMYSENGTYTVVLTASNATGDSDVAQADVVIDVVVADTEAPVITLLGDAEVTITVGDTYEDAGATANDNADGDITSSIVVTGTVDEATAGTYTLNYNVSDAAGNDAVEVSRTVIVAPVVANCTPETEQNLTANGLNITMQSDPASAMTFDAVDFFYIDNPDTDNDVNSSCKVGQITKTGASPWDNMQIIFDSNIDFSQYAGFKMKVWNFDAGASVLMKMEGTAGGSTGDVVATLSGTESWEELTFPFAAGETNKWDKLVVFFDGGDQSTKTYYFDDLMLYDRTDGGGGGSATPIVNFENALAGITKGQFGGGVTAELIANPVSGGINTSANVFQVNYTSGSEWWGGTELDFGTGVLDASATVYKAKLYSTVANSNVLFQVETASNVGTTGEVQTIVNANEWVEVAFTMPNPPAQVNRIIIRPDVSDQSSTKANTGTLYIDDIVCESCTLGSGGGGGGGGGNAAGLVNGDFEDGDAGWILFQNGGSASFDNTINNGGSNSGKLSITGPGNPAFKQERFGAGIVEAGDVVTVTFDHTGSAGGEGGFMNVLLFVEIPDGAAGNPITHIFEPRPVLSDSWGTFTGTFTIPAGSNVAGGLSLLIETVCGGAPGCEVSANIDNVTVTF